MMAGMDAIAPSCHDLDLDHAEVLLCRLYIITAAIRIEFLTISG
jgi:hypothetical protein